MASGTPSQPVPLMTAAWIFFWRSMRACRSAGGELQSVEHALLLPEDQIRARRSGRVERDHAVDRLVSRRRDQRHRAAVPAPGHHDPPLVDVVALRQPPHRRADVVRVVGERGRLGPASALAPAAAVVAQDQDAGVGELLREMREHGNAVDDLVAVGRRGAADENDGRMAQASGDAGRRRHACRPG